jgi:hypothetical protein
MTANEIITDVVYLNIVGNATSLEYRIKKFFVEEFNEEPEYVSVNYVPKVIKDTNNRPISVGVMKANVSMKGIDYCVVRDYEEEYYKDRILAKK